MILQRDVAFVFDIHPRVVRKVCPYIYTPFTTYYYYYYYYIYYTQTPERQFAYLSYLYYYYCILLCYLHTIQ